MMTLLLDQTVWDVCLDADGNIAMASDPYAQAQDAASALRLFSGEAYYDTTRGVPYFGQILGRFPPAPLIKAQFVKAALTVPGIVAAICTLASIRNRQLSGQVRITNVAGVSLSVAFNGGSTSIGA
jgi:hypothetical protein